MKKLLYILVFLSALISADSYGQIYTYTSATNGAPSFTAANTTYSNLTAIGTGSNTPCGQGFSGITGFTNAGYNPNGPVVSVLVRPNACYKLNITGFQAGLRRSGTGPAQARLVYSIDGGATWVLCPTVFSPLNSGCATSAGGTTNASWTTNVTVTSSTLGIIFRICPYGASGSGGTLQVWGLNIYGTVTPCAPTLTPVVTNVSCNGGTNGGVVLNVLNGCNPFTYSWTGPNSFTVNTQNISNVPAGTYSVTVSSPGGCSSNTTATITQPAALSVTAGNNGPVCSGTNLNLTASNLTNATYVWAGPNSFSANTQNTTVNAIPMAGAGVYTVTATVNGCTATGTTIVAVNPSPLAVLGTVTNPSTCSGTDGSIVLTGLAPISVFTLNYTKNGVPQNVTVASDINGVITIDNLGAGTYDNIILTLGACISNTLGPVTLTDPPIPATPVANANTPLCSGAALNLSTANVPNATYSWTGPNTFSSNTQNPVIDPVAVVAAGTYSVTTTVNNCTSLPGTVAVVVNPTPVIAGTQFTNPTTCGGVNGTISLTGLTANTMYNVDYSLFAIPQPTISVSSNNIGTVVLSGLASGIYDNFTVTLNGCVSNLVGPITLTDPAPPAISGSSFTGPTTCGGSNGSISLTGLLANTTYSLNYDLNSTPQVATNLTSDNTGAIILSGLSAGSYSNITVTLNNCVSNIIGPISLMDPAAPVITNSTSTNPSTCNGSDGFISLNGLLANTTYTVNYDFNSNPQAAVNITSNNTGVLLINNLVSGTYDNIFLTLNACISNTVGPIVLTDPPIPAVIATTNAPICEGNTLNLYATLVNNATYSWTGPGGFTSNAQNPVINNGLIPHSGQYIVSITVNNCTSLPDTVDVLVAPMPTVPVIANNGPLCSGNDLYLTADNIPGATFNWTGPNGFSSNDQNPVITMADQNASGTYQVNSQIGTCISAMASMQVVVNPGTVAPVTANLTYCQFAPAAILTATGQNLLWYTTSTGGTGTVTAPTPATTVAGTVTYYVSQTMNNCESPRTPLEVLVNEKPAVPVADSVLDYCQGAVATTLAATGQNILWYDNLTGGTSTATAPTPATSVPGIFKYYVTQTINGCESDRKQIEVTINNKPNAPATQNVAYCTGEVATPLVANGTNLLWYTSPTVTPGSTNASVPVTTSPDSVTWFVTQTVGGCESDRAQLTVLIHQQPSVVLSASKNEFCQYETVQFTSTLNVTPQTQYEWTIPGSAEIETGGTMGTAGIRFDNFGTYNVSLFVDNRGCTAADTVSVTVREAPVATVSLPEHACVGDEVTIGLGYVSSGVDDYAWNFGGATIIDSRSNAGPYKVRWSHPGVYTVKLTVSDSVCSSDRNEDTITVHYLPDAAIKPVKQGQLCVGDKIRVEAFVKESTWKYKWSPASFFENGDNNAVGDPIVRATGNIYLTIKTPFGCTATDSVFVETQPCCNVWFPTAFSPNNDGRNDIFRPVTDGNHDLGTFVVVNRWGQTVFETVNNNEGWDGKRNSQPLDIGVYYYYYKYKCDGKVMEQKGEITLVR